MLTSQQAFVLQLERLSPRIWNSTEQSAKLSRLLATGGGKAESVSLHAFRMDIQTQNPSTVAANDTDGGTLPSGNNSAWNQFTLLPQTYVLPIGFTHQAQRLASPKDVSNIDPVAKTISDVVEQAAKVRDLFLQTPGDGSLGTVDSVSGLSILLRSTTTSTVDGRGAHLVDIGQTIQVQSGGGAYVPRGNARINDRFNFLGGVQSITVDAVPPGTIGGDLIIMQGLPGGAPVGPNGIPVFVSTLTAGTLLGLPRILSYVQANGVNAGNSQLSVPMLRIAENQPLQRLGDKSQEGLFWHWHPSESQAYEELGWMLQYIPLQGGKAGDLDLLFNKPGMRVNGRKIYENIHADQTRGDLLNKDVWCMVKWGAETPYWLKSRTGAMFFPVYDQTTGLVTTNETAYQQEAYQWGCGNPSTQGGFFSARVPTGN